MLGVELGDAVAEEGLGEDHIVVEAGQLHEFLELFAGAGVEGQFCQDGVDEFALSPQVLTRAHLIQSVATKRQYHYLPLRQGFPLLPRPSPSAVPSSSAPHYDFAVVVDVVVVGVGGGQTVQVDGFQHSLQH